MAVHDGSVASSSLNRATKRGWGKVCNGVCCLVLEACHADLPRDVYVLYVGHRVILSHATARLHGCGRVQAGAATACATSRSLLCPQHVA
jgi:hypothetical protein